MAKQHGWNANIPPNAVILAGGKSRRFGSAKAWAELHGKPMIRIISDSLENAGFRIMLSTNTPQEYQHLEYPIICDTMPYHGPLYALYNIFNKSDLTKVLLVACDMPLLSPPISKALWAKSDGWDITLLLDKKGRFSPLPAVYSRNILPLLEQQMRNNRKDLKSLLELDLKVQMISWKDWSSLDPLQNALLNVNTVLDLKEIVNAAR